MGAALNDNNTPTPVDDAIDLGAAIGFSITGGSVAMALVRPATATRPDKTSYLGAEITLGGASLVGIDGLTLQGERHGAGQQGDDSDGPRFDAQRINWASGRLRGGLLPDFSAPT